MEMFSELIAAAAGHPLTKFFIGVLVFGVFIGIVMAGLNVVTFNKMLPGPKRTRWRRIVSHVLPAVVAVVLFGNELFVMGPRRGWWGYIGAALMGWLGSIAAIGLHHWRKARAMRPA